MDFLSAEEILACDDKVVENVEIPEWSKNGKPAGVRVSSISGTERDRLEASVTQSNAKGQTKVTLENFRARLCALACVNDKGVKLFTEAQVVRLGQKNAAALDRIYEVAARLSRLRKEDVDELFPPSANGQNEDSTSDSPAISDAP
jgi:hypothetical protein